MPSEAFGMIEMELNFVYEAMYTKSPVTHTGAGWALRCVCSGCILSALVIFFHHDKGGIAHVDVGITYALLLGAVALDVVALAMFLFSDLVAIVFQSRRHLRWLARLTQAVTRRWWRPRRWSRTTSQFNLISYCLGKPDHCRLWHRLAKVLRVEGILEDLIFMRRVRLKKDDGEDRYGRLRWFFWGTLVPKCCRNKENVSESLLFGFIFRGLKDALHRLREEQETKAAAAAAGTGTREEATEEEIEAEKDAMAEKDAIAEVCRRRGDGVVKSHKDDIINKATTDGDGVVKSHEDDIKRVKGTTDGDARFKVILDSVVKSAFDESLLLWHIATDLCRYRANDVIVPAAAGDAGGETVSVRPVGPLSIRTMEMQAIGETLSEYMLYLLIKQPEMESARTGIWLMRYQDSCTEARRFFDSMAAWRMLLSVNTTKKPVQVKGDRSKSVLFDGVILAKALRELDEELMWDVITGVWGEMLIYTASKCRGTTHVHLLNRGGELITLVWFLMASMGLADTCQIQKGDAKAKLIVHDQ